MITILRARVKGIRDLDKHRLLIEAGTGKSATLTKPLVTGSRHVRVWTWTFTHIQPSGSHAFELFSSRGEPAVSQICHRLCQAASYSLKSDSKLHKP